MLLKKIVVAEDDDAIAHMVNMALGDAGFLCFRAKDGQEALQLVRTHAPDVLVLDVMMPKVDGYTVVRELKGDPLLSRIPVMMLTAMGTTDEKVKGFDAGADDYITKPFDLREFAARVKAHIRASRREQSRNPVTQLPGSSSLDDFIENLIQKETGFAAVQLSLRGFDNLARTGTGEQVHTLLRTMGDSLVSLLRQKSDTVGFFLAHCGGADFVVVCPDTVAASVTDDGLARLEQCVSDRANLTAIAAVASSVGAKTADEFAERLAATYSEVAAEGRPARSEWNAS